MPGFGEYLKEKRVAGGISLETISATTRISVRQLEALEAEQFNLLPGGVFNVSFARQYARCVGLDEDDVTARLKAVYRPPALKLVIGEIPEAGEGAEQVGAKLAEKVIDYARERRSTLAGAIVGLALLLGGAFLYERIESEPAPAVSAETNTDGVHELQPAGAARVKMPVVEPAAAEQAPVHPSDAPIQLELRLTDTVWVKVVADGKRVLEENLRPGDTRSIEARDFVRIVVGNAGGVKVALNGEAMPPIGPSGHVRRVLVKPTSFEVLEAPPKDETEVPVNDPLQRET